MAGVKITDLGAITEAASDDLLYIVDVSDTSESPQGTSKKIELGNIGKSYKVYTALLSQTGTDAPTAIELENTIDGTISINYLGTGIYEVSNSITWDVTKTWYTIGGLGDIGSIPSTFPCFRLIGFEGTSLLIYTLDNTLSTPQNDTLNNTPIEIRVYN